MTLGTQTDAERALSFRHIQNQFYIGSGAFRTAYLINGVVYKMTSECENWVNSDELDIYNNLNIDRFPDWLRVPVMTGFLVDDQIVIAAEHITGIVMYTCTECQDSYSDYCGQDDCLGGRADVLHSLGFADAHCDGNTVQHADGTLYIVDLPG